MIFDIIVVLILAVSIFTGFRAGFVYTCIHTVGWLLSLLMGFIWAPEVKKFIMEKTNIYDYFYDNIFLKFSESLSLAEDSFQNLPEIIREGISSAAGTMVSSLSQTMASLLFTILSFVLVVFAVKFILWMIMELLSKKHNDGFSSIPDGILGLLAGLVKGFLILFILFAVMLPVSELISPGMSDSLFASLSKSSFALELYNNNLLLLIIQDMLA